jgi:hypothetical protein
MFRRKEIGVLYMSLVSIQMVVPSSEFLSTV